jgi:CTP-dependent riboflavin kinase
MRYDSVKQELAEDGTMMVTFVGNVRDGIGGASRDVAAGVYPSSLLGFAPAVGSLNLDADTGVPAQLRAIRRPLVVHYAGTAREMWPATLAVNGWPVWVQWHRNMPQGVVELFAEQHLRSSLGLRNGDPIRVNVNADMVDEVERS